jgi:hypothetical protein
LQWNRIFQQTVSRPGQVGILKFWFRRHPTKDISFPLNRQFIQQRREHLFCQVPLELFHSSEMLLTVRTSCLNDFVFHAHERE